MAMRFKPKSDHTMNRTLQKPTTIYDAHAYMPHHSLYATQALRKKRAKRQQLEERKGEFKNIGHFMTSNFPFTGSHEDRSVSGEQGA